MTSISAPLMAIALVAVVHRTFCAPLSAHGG
jgi:hypothetical protein